MLEWLEDERAQALVLETPALHALGRVTAYETSACKQHCFTLIRLPPKLGVRSEGRMFFLQFRQSLSKDAIHGPIAGCNMRNRQAQVARGLLGLEPRGVKEDSQSYCVLHSSTNFAGRGYRYVVPSAKSQARATAAAARDGAAHLAAADAYQAERLAHPDSGPAGARAASGASMEQSRTGANFPSQARLTAAAAAGGAAYQAGAAHSEYRLLAYVPCFPALSHFQDACVLTYSPCVSRSPTPRH